MFVLVAVHFVVVVDAAAGAVAEAVVAAAAGAVVAGYCVGVDFVVMLWV